MKKFILTIGSVVLWLNGPCAEAKTTPIPKAVIDAARGFIIAGGDGDHVDRMIVSWRKRGVFYRADISPSGAPDWVIDTAKAKESYYCGTGGCETEILSADAQGRYHLVFSAQVLDYSFAPLKDHTYKRLKVNYHGVFCGGTGGSWCPFAYSWSKTDEGFGLRPDLSFFPVDHYLNLPLPSPLMSVFETNDSIVPNSLPAPLEARLSHQRAYCHAKGGRLYEENNIAVSLPDLNEDGIEDIAYLGLQTSCEVVVDPETEGVDYVPADLSTSENLVWLSDLKTNGSIDWRAVNFPKNKPIALHIRANHGLELVILDELPENAHAAYPSCDIFALANCVITPIQLMSKP